MTCEPTCQTVSTATFLPPKTKSHPTKLYAASHAIRASQVSLETGLSLTTTLLTDRSSIRRHALVGRADVLERRDGSAVGTGHGILSGCRLRACAGLTLRHTGRGTVACAAQATACGLCKRYS